MSVMTESSYNKPHTNAVDRGYPADLGQIDLQQ